MKQGFSEKIWTKSFISISLTQFLLFTVFYALMTTLPLFVISDLDETETKAGLVATFMLATAILIRPFSAKIIDRYGKKNILFLAVFAYLLATVLYIFVDAFTPLAIVRLFHGLSFGIVTTVTGAIVADIIPASRRGEAMGYFAMSNSIAMVIGPFIGLGLIHYIAFRGLFIVLSVFMVVAVVSSLMIDAKKLAPRHNISGPIRLSDMFDKNALPISLISVLVGIAYGSILSFVPVYAESLSLAHASSYFFLVYAFVMVLSRPYLGRLFDQKGPRFVLLPSLAVFAIGLFVLSGTHSVFVFMLAAVLIGLGYGTVLPGFQTVIVQQAGVNRSSQAFSTFFTCYDLGIGAGSFLWGAVSSAYGFSNMYLSSGLSIVLAAIMFDMYLVRMKKRVNKTK